MNRLTVALLTALLIALLLAMPAAAPLLRALFAGPEPAVYDRGSFATLALSQAVMVLIALAVAGAAALAAAIVATRPAGRAWRPLFDQLASGAQAFPPTAILALCVPALGFGAKPTVVALTLAALLPLLRGAIAGLDSVPAELREAASGLGFSPRQTLLQIELPLAAPLILAGLRTAAAIALGTATIGSTIGALTLGTPIIEGLVANRPGFILQGAIPLALMALILNRVLSR